MKKKPIRRSSHQKKHPLIGVLTTLSVIILGVIIWYTIPKQSNLSINQIIEETGKVELRLDPDTRTISPNTELSLNLQASTEASKIIGNQIEITYSPGCGTPTVVQGSHFTNTLASPKIENGKINFTYVAPPESGGITGHAISIATIKIKPNSVGICDLNFTENNLVTIADSTRNEVRSLTNSRITIAVANPSDSASSIPSAIPSTTPQKPNKPTGLRSNCFDNGTKITLRWDAVSGATSYKVRLDQKDGAADKSTDNLTKTEHNYDLIPDQKYSWWVHATRNGVDSEEARIAEVVCAKSNTSSPTPSPSPKSTPKPTLKPTPKPTPKPTTKASTAPSATPPQLSPLPSTIANSSVTSGSLNDIFRDIEEVKDQPQTVSDLNLFQKIARGWQAIINALSNIF